MIDFYDYFLGADDVFQARKDTAFSKTRLAAQCKWLNLQLSYTKVQTRLVNADFFSDHRLAQIGTD